MIKFDYMPKVDKLEFIVMFMAEFSVFLIGTRVNLMMTMKIPKMFKPSKRPSCIWETST